jgi:hypothetical protein
MARIHVHDLPADLTPEQEELIQGAGLKSFKPGIESLEAREVYAAHLGAAVAPELLASARVAALDPAPEVQQHVLVNQIQMAGPAAASGVNSLAHAAPIPEVDVGVWATSSVTSAGTHGSVMRAAGVPREGTETATVTNSPNVHFNADGTVTVDTKDGHQVYRRVYGAWVLTRSAQQVGNEWIEYTLQENGTGIWNSWTSKDRGQEGSRAHLSQLVIANGKATLTAYHAAWAYYKNYWFWGRPHETTDAKVTWVYSVNADGNPNYGDLLEYHLLNHDGNRNDWLKSRVGKGGDGYRDDGWNENTGGYGKGLLEGDRYLTSGAFRQAPGQTLVLPEPTREVKDGKRVETIWNADRTHVITYEYSGPDGKQVIAQTFAQRNDKGQWTVTTTHPGDAVYKRTEVYETYGGRLLSRETTRTAADGRTVTFTGKWEGGRWIERAGDYLDYKSVTLDYGSDPNGPFRRSGELKSSLWCEEEFNAAGQMTSRTVSNNEGVKEVWRREGSKLIVDDSSGGRREYEMDVNGQWRLTSYSVRIRGYPRDWTYRWWRDSLGKYHEVIGQVEFIDRWRTGPDSQYVTPISSNPNDTWNRV